MIKASAELSKKDVLTSLSCLPPLDSGQKYQWHRVLPGYSVCDIEAGITAKKRFNFSV